MQAGVWDKPRPCINTSDSSNTTSYSVRSPALTTARPTGHSTCATMPDFYEEDLLRDRIYYC